MWRRGRRRRFCESSVIIGWFAKIVVECMQCETRKWEVHCKTCASENRVGENRGDGWLRCTDIGHVVVKRSVSALHAEPCFELTI